MVPLRWKLRLSVDHFGLLMPLNHQAEKEVTILTGMANPNYQTETQVLLYSMDNYIRSPGGFTGCLLGFT